MPDDLVPQTQPVVSDAEPVQQAAITPSVVATAKATQLTAEDAAALNATEYKSKVGLTSKDAPAYLAAHREQAMANSFQEMSGWDAASARWIASQRNASVIQDSLDKWKVYHESVARAQLPDPSGMWATLGQTLKQSGRRAAYGLAAIPVSLGAPIEAALTGGWENTTLFALSDAALAKEREEGADMGDIAARHEVLGGGRLPLLTGQLLGQLPEMLVSGIGSAVVAKVGIRQLLAAEAKAAVAAGRASLTTEMAKKAMLGASALQAGQEGGRVLMDRGIQNVDQGKDAFTSKDVAAAMVTGVVVMATEMLGGLTGEMAFLGGKGVRGAATNVATQAGQEAVQEALPSILTDLMDGKELQWDEYGWQALGGMIGGGLFGSVAFIGAMQHASPQKQDVVKRMAPLIASAAQAGKAEANASGFDQRVKAMSEAASSKRMSQQELAAGLEATGGKLEQHFNTADFAKIAEAKGISPEALMAQLGVKDEAGIVTVKDSVLTAFAINEKPDVQQMISNTMKATPETPSKVEAVEAFETLSQVGKDMVEPTLPDGTKDDSTELEAVVAAEIAAADKVAGSKRTPAMAKREATINAAMARAAAIEWNAHYAAQGKADRVTPKQIWEKTKGSVTGDAGTGGLQQADSRGTYDWNKALVRIGKAADASTVHHELMHHWLETARGWAADPAAPDVYRQQMADIGAWATDNAGSIAKAYAKVSGKTVSADDVRTAAADVSKIDLNTDSGKAIHEAMSYAYEEYLSTGKAPTKELQSVFNQIANYFRSIYGVLRKYVTAAGEPLLDKKVSKIFDRMLVSADMEQQNHLSPETIEKAKLTPQVVELLDAIYSERIGQAQSDAYERMRKSLQAQSAAKLAKVTEDVKAELAKIPVFKAQLALAAKKLDAAAVAILTRGTPQDGLNMAEWTQNDGAQPTDVAIEAGYTNGALEMLQELSAAPLYEDAVAQTVESRMDRDADPSMDERIAAMADAKEGRLALLAAELRALKAPLQVATATAKAVKAEEQVAAAVATSEELARVKAEYKAKIEQIAAKAKMEQSDFEAARQSFNEWIGKDANSYAIFEATRRMQNEPMTFGEITAMIPKASAKVSKLAGKGHFKEALSAHLEVEVLTQMAKQAKNRDVATVKANADAALARKALEVSDVRQQGKDKKAMVQKWWSRESAMDVEEWNKWANQQVARTPVSDLREGQWEARANAAMKRRGKFAADGNVAGIIRETESIAAAIAMEAAVLRSLKKRAEYMETITDGVSNDSLVKLQSAGHYTVINDQTGEITSYYTEEAARIAEANAGKAATTTRSTDLLVIGDMIRKLMRSRSRDGAAQMLTNIVTKQDIGYANVTPAFERMIAQGRLDPESWLMADWETIANQVEQLQATADARPSVSAQRVADIQAGVAAVPDAETPPTQSSDRSRAGRFATWVAASVINLRTHVQKLGAFGEDVILGGATRAETKQKEFQDVIAKMMKGVYTFTRSERKALDEPISMYGVQTSRMQNLARLLMWGTDTGRQRVMADLRTRGINPGDMVMFMGDCFKNVTAKEAAFMNRMWEANDRIWEWDSAAARSAGIKLAKKLKARPFRVMSDTGESITLSGGYASVPYSNDSDFSQIDLMSPEGLAAAKVGLGWNNERANAVTGRMLDLSLDAQHKAQMSHIRAAAFLPYAEQMNALLVPTSDFSKKATKHLGNDWMNDLKDHLRFIFNGVPRGGANDIMSVVHQGQTMAVFGLNMLTAAKQVGGVIVSAGHKDVGVIPALGAAAQVLLSPRQALRFAADKSMAFASRWELGPDTDFASPEAVIGHQRLYRKWLHLSTAPMRVAQGVADLVTWTAAYNRFKGEHADMEPEKLAYEARRVADRALMETQGSAMRTEAARVNQQQIGVCVTFGGKWMLNNTNWMIRLYRGGDKGAFCKAALASVVVSSAAMTGISALLQPEDDDEKKRTYRDYAYKVGFDILGQPHYVMRMISDAAYGQVTEGSVRGGSSIISTGRMAISGMTTIFDQLEDDKNSDDWEKIIGGAVQAGSIFPTGIPAVQAKRALDNWVYDDKNWKSGWERFVAGVFGADGVARAKR